MKYKTRAQSKNSNLNPFNVKNKKNIYQFKKFVKVKKITIKRTMIRSEWKKPEGGTRKSILKIISNKTNNNKKNGN
jgi:hypothetical protein